MELNYYKSIKQPTVARNVSVEWWLNEIQTGNLYKEEILKARAFGKGKSEYNSIKESLPAVTWNFHFDKYKKDSNIISSTGFIYFDIDSCEFKVSSLDKNKVFSFFSSLSNCGVSVIVKASGVTESNFASTYKAIAEELGIAQYVDVNAAKKSQYTVLTYDAAAFVNPDAFVFGPATAPPSRTEKVSLALNHNPVKKVSLALNQRIKEEIHIGANDTFLRYNNFDSFIKPDDVVVNEDGFDTLALYLPGTIKEGKRKHTLLSYCNNFVLLNPNLPPAAIYSHLEERNKQRCVTPLPGKEIADIVNSVMKYKKEGTLKPIGIKKRKILFGKNTGMNAADKMSYAAQQVAEWKRDKTKQKIYQVIEEMEGKKITAESVAQASGLGIATVKRYWKEFKEFVKQKNAK